ncbi:Rrf2 family transcriptional regulator [Geobacter sp. FeAm09]|uniref:RrF2 family transcriptional regulator n=1 Tax=Geobacter sp. FeAm09 TaxID=2597769 RepID=UPI0011EF2F42|nr:Rrf2 family transcriptional regulator [Geobacter sp. FeAm09]QEM68004.1 Rrf2 family transcriptional regulator [Geobacter sp. FeAm09]QEM68840.1 Rrf2 family transcriptional regulator [Geobacter sp. FeAm09]
MISKKTKYALKALYHLAGQPSSQPVLISELAKAGNIPKKFLEFILLSLRKGGILQSRIGKGGGYYLASPPARITLGSVVRILEGDLAPVQCLSETNYAKCDECDDEATCGIRLVMVDVNKALIRVLDSLTLADMLERSETERSKLANVLDFSI